MFEPSEFFHFLRRPRYLPHERKETNVIATAIKTYLLLILFVALANGLIIVCLQAFISLPIDESNFIPDRLKDHLWVYFLIVAIIGPVVEEIVFRLSLIFNPVYISLSISTLLGLLAHRFTNRINAFIIFLILFFLIYQIALKYSSGLDSFWNKNFKYLFYIFPLMFGLVHMWNYRYTDSTQYLIAPLMVFPQLAMGFVLSFTRMYYRKGFILSILIHILLNSVATSITIAQYPGSINP